MCKKGFVRLIFLACCTSTVLANDQYLLNTLQAMVPIPEQLAKIGTLVDPTTAEHRGVAHQDPCPLFDAYPELQKTLPHINLLDLPTPITKLERLGKVAGNAHIYMKHDDVCRIQLPDGTRAYGGNKPRKLEFLLADALYHGAQTVLTWGCVASNHALATAWYAKSLGLRSILMLCPQPNSRMVRKNLALMHAVGAQMHFCTDRHMRNLGTAYACMRNKLDHGDFPYCIPTGGDIPLGAVGFVNAAFELKHQIQAGVIPGPDYIVVPCGPYAGTTAGLLVGLKVAELKTKLIAIAVEPAHKEKWIATIVDLAQKTNVLLHRADPSFPLFGFSAHDLELVVEFAGEDYGQFSPEGVAAIKLLKDHEHISLDGTYTGKAFAGMLAKLPELPRNATVLFWNTYCAQEYPALTNNTDIQELPLVLQRYFNEPVQELDR